MRANSKVIETSHDNIVRKSNDLVMTKLSHGLSISQMQLLAYAIYTTQQDNKANFVLTDFEKKFNRERYQTKSIHSDINKLISIRFSEKNYNGDSDGLRVWNAFSEIYYARGEFHFEWSEKMKPHIMELKEKYIVTDLAIAGMFQSSYSWILYEYLKAHYGYWHRIVDKEELLNIFGVQNTKAYQHTGSLKNKVIDVAVAEINKYTELEVKYESIKEGRTIVGFKFNWSVGTAENMMTVAQQEQLTMLIASVLDDAFKYFDVQDMDKLHQIREAIQVLRDTAIYIKSEEIRTITSEQAKVLIQDTTLTVSRIEGLYTTALDAQRNPQPIKKAPFYNWLETRECRTCGSEMSNSTQGFNCEVCKEEYRTQGEERERRLNMENSETAD